MNRPRTVPVVVLALLVCAAASLPAQAPTRRLTTLDALRQFPGYFHLSPVVVRGEFAEAGTRITLRAHDQDMRVMLNDGVSTTTGPVEVRGSLLDIGRLEPGDPRLGRYDGATSERWPRPGEELVLVVTSVTAVQPSNTTSVRTVAMEPWRYEGQTVTVVGQFRGRNLFGDLPGAPAKSRYDFVLRGSEGAVWVTGLRPRGRGFDLDVDARVDTSHWLEVSGLVSMQRGLVTIEAKTMVSTPAPAAQTEVEPADPVIPLPAAEVVFSTPSNNETDVAAGTTVRLQFSRGVNPATVPGNIVASYGTDAPAAGDPTPAVPPAAPSFRTAYDAATRSVELRFAQPLDRLKTVVIETREGLKAFDGAPVTPWRIVFTTGG